VGYHGGMSVRTLVPVVLVLLCSPALQSGTVEDFETLFSGRTLRVDTWHTGDASRELVSLDRLVLEGVWAGSRTHLVDERGLGRYRAVLRDPREGRVVFLSCHDSYFGEYATTAAASEGRLRSFHESLRLPLPRRPMVLTLERRAGDGTFRTLLELTVDPSDPEIVDEPPLPGAVVVRPPVVRELHGAVDIAVLGEGYTAEEEALFRRDLAQVREVLLSREPYASFRDRINLWGVLVPSADSGIDEPGRGVWRRTALGLRYNSLGSPRYVLTEDNRALREAASHVPYDTLVIMVNADRYGGGGIFNLYCTFAAHSSWAPYLLLHEFGHSFTGLADEYYTSSVAYEDFHPGGREPAEPNITTVTDRSRLKWRDLVEDGTPLPTPWSKEAFDRMEAAYQERRSELNAAIAAAMRSGAEDAVVRRLVEEADGLSRHHAERVGAFLAKERYAGVVGAFEGAGYLSRGMYRPMLDCIMFSRGAKPYCRVCERAVRSALEWASE